MTGMGASPGELAVLILAAGQGTRMASDRNKVMHDLAGRPMLGFPLAAAEALRPNRLAVVVGNGADEVRARFAERASFVTQAERRGTGHAVLQAHDFLAGFRGDVLVLYGDTRCCAPRAWRMLGIRRRPRELVMLTARWPLPGRIVRDARGRVQRVVELTDATPEELSLEEGNTGVYLLSADLLWKALSQVDNQNAQGEIYLTDVVGYAARHGHPLEAISSRTPRRPWA
jgi:bifunctional UDP-N-acetylglucosamine pyrophosphorylase/glucosamine-1-phosphate N-acetyltransferase